MGGGFFKFGAGQWPFSRHAIHSLIRIYNNVPD